MGIQITPAVTAHPALAPGGLDGGTRASNRTVTQNIRHVTLGNVLSGQVTGLTLGETYTFRVRAYDAAGNGSAWSDPIQVTTVASPTPVTVAAVASVPSVIGPPTVTATTVAGSASIPGPRAGFQRSQTPAGTTASFTGLQPGKQYYARVRARDAAGNWSAWSTDVPFTTIGTPAPATVAAVTAFPARTVGGTPPTVTAGRARPVVRGGTVDLDVTATPPGGESIIGYQWTIISGGGSLTNATTATPTYTAPGSGSGLVTIRATVSATNAGQASADMTVSYHGTIIAAENALTGTARATWDLASPNLGGISTLQGFVDGFTVNKSGTVNFKIAQSDGAGWSAEVFRLGYYAGDGARSYGALTPSGGQVTTSQSQPSPGDADAGTTLLSADCSNWSTSLTWSPPAWAPTGMYVLRLNRTGGGASHILFILRDDARHADLMFMPADSTWNAYNAWGGMGGSMYGGNSLYYGTAVDQYNADCARFVSYDRPVVNRGAADSGRSYGAVEWSNFFTAEYGMLRFLERCGYDVKYYGCIDSGGDASGTHLTGNGGTRGGVNAGIFVGHNEYWSDAMRSGWETAKAAGVSVFSCAGNEVFWRTVGTSADSDGRPRLIECQKSTIGGRGNTRPQWTGTWRDPDGAGKGGNQPENTFTGTIFCVNGPDMRSLVVPFNGGYSGQPLWRHTSVASLTTGQTYTSAAEILGFEWDTYGPAGVSTTAANFMAAPHQSARYCSTATYSISSGLLLTDAGDVYDAAGTATHRLVVTPSSQTAGGLTFGTGTVNWALGVDNANTYQQGSDNTDDVLRQATVNILMDMGAAPATLPGTLTMPSAVDWFANPGTVAAIAAIPGPTVTSSSATTVSATTVAGAAAVAAPTVRLGVATAPATVAAAATVPAPTVRLGVLPAPATVAATTTVTGTALRYTGALADAFDDGTLNPTLWALSHGTVGEAGGRAFVECGTGFPAISTGNSYALDRFHVQVFPAARNTATTEATTGVMFQSPSVPGGTDIGFVFDRVNDLLHCVSRTGYFDGGDVTVAFPSGTASLWVRLSLSDGNVLWDTSTDGLSWTNRRTLTAPAWVTTAADGRVLFEAHRSDGTVNSSEFDNLNVVPATVAPATVAAVAAVGTASAQTSSGSSPTPSTVTAITAVSAPTIAAGSAPAPATVGAAAGVPSRTPTSNAAPAPATVQATTAVPGPSVTVRATATPATVAATATVPAPSVQTSSGGNVSVSTVVAAAAVPGPAVQTSSGTTVTAPTVTGAATVPGPAVSAGTGRAPATVAAVATVTAPTVIATNSPAPGTVVAVTAIAGPTMATGTRPGPLTVTAVTTIATPTAGGTVATGPATVVATATIPAATARIYAQVIAATVTAVASIGTIRHTVGQVITSTGTATITGGLLPGTVTGEPLTARIVDGTT